MRLFISLTLLVLGLLATSPVVGYTADDPAPITVQMDCQGAYSPVTVAVTDYNYTCPIDATQVEPGIEAKLSREQSPGVKAYNSFIWDKQVLYTISFFDKDTGKINRGFKKMLGIGLRKLG